MLSHLIKILGCWWPAILLILTTVAYFRGETEYRERHWSRHGDQWDPKLLRWGSLLFHLHDAYVQQLRLHDTHVQQLRLSDAHVQWLLLCDAHIQCQCDADVQQCSHSHSSPFTSTSFQQLHFPPSSVSPTGQPCCYAGILQPLYSSA